MAEMDDLPEHDRRYIEWFQAVRDRVRYYDVARHWTKKIKAHLGDRGFNRTLVRDFNKLTTGLWGMPFRPGMYPDEFESIDWRSHFHPPHPRFWRYVRPGACHWLVNANLRLISLAEPSRPWRIVSSSRHSTVWDGDRTLFEMNFVAFGFPPDVCWDLAAEGGKILAPGVERPTVMINMSHIPERIRYLTEPPRRKLIGGPAGSAA
jgi:hypothetical protein